MKRLNSADSEVKRPIRVSDLQDIWDGLTNALAVGTDTEPRIVSGFETTGLTVGGGVIAFEGRLYVMPDGLADVGDVIYGEELTDDIRLFGDGLPRTFAFEYVVTKTPTPTVIGALTFANIAAWKLANIPFKSLGTDKIADRSITREKLHVDMITVYAAAMTYSGIDDMTFNAVGGDFTVEPVVGYTGRCIVSTNASFSVVPLVLPAGGSGGRVEVLSQGVNSFTVQTYSSSNQPQDDLFYFYIFMGNTTYIP